MKDYCSMKDGMKKGMAAKDEAFCRFISPMTDFGFKRIFGSEGGRIFLNSFLNSLLGAGISIEEYLDKEVSPDSAKEKQTIFDILCKDSTGQRFIVEMQVRRQPHFIQRSLYYMCRNITGQLKKGGKYTDIRPVVGIFFLGSEMDMDTESHVGVPRQGCINDYILTDKTGGGDDYDSFRQIYISLSRFNKAESECTGMIDKWIYTIKNMERLNEMPFKDDEELFRKLEEYAETSNMDPDQRLAYDLYVDSLRAYDRTLEYETKMASEKARREGHEEGREDGRKEEKMKIARTMLDMGFDETSVCKVTGLSRETIAQIALEQNPSAASAEQQP